MIPAHIIWKLMVGDLSRFVGTFWKIMTLSEHRKPVRSKQFSCYAFSFNSGYFNLSLQIIQTKIVKWLLLHCDYIDLSLNTVIKCIQSKLFRKANVNDEFLIEFLVHINAVQTLISHEIIEIYVNGIVTELSVWFCICKIAYCLVCNLKNNFLLISFYEILTLVSLIYSTFMNSILLNRDIFTFLTFLQLCYVLITFRFVQNRKYKTHENHAW